MKMETLYVSGSIEWYEADLRISNNERFDFSITVPEDQACRMKLVQIEYDKMLKELEALVREQL